MSASGSLNSIPGLSPFRFLTVLLINCIWVAPLLLVSASSAHASDTYTVTANTDDYSGTPTTLAGIASHCPANGTQSGCTLRDAITAAVADPGSTVRFSVTGTNSLAFVLPVITTNITIAGPGANALTISGGYQQWNNDRNHLRADASERKQHRRRCWADALVRRRTLQPRLNTDGGSRRVLQQHDWPTHAGR